MVFLSLSLVMTSKDKTEIQKAIDNVGNLELHISDVLGRHLCAQRDFHPGEVIAKENLILLEAARGPLSAILIGLNVDLIASKVPFLDDLSWVDQDDMDDISCLSVLQIERVKKIMTNGISLGKCIAISAIISMASHSCQPAADYGVTSGVLSLVALRPIAKGDIVSVRYGHCHEMPKRYGFNCGCGGETPPRSSLKIIQSISRDDEGTRLVLDYPAEILHLLEFKS